METIRQFFARPFVRRLVILACVGVALYLFRSLLTMFLLTFIFIYLVNEAQKHIYNLISRFIPVKRAVIVASLYVVFLAAVVLAITLNIGKIADQCTQIYHSILRYANYLTSQGHSKNKILAAISNYLKNKDFSAYAANGGKYVFSMITSVGGLGVDIVFALILSLFFMLGKSRTIAFFRKFKNSKLSFLYDDLRDFARKFTNSFGKVIETQVTIAAINSVISLIALWLLGFPNLLGLWFMIFFLGLIPVAGVFISLVPLCVIAYSIGGIRYIVYTLILVAVLHMLESYVLNPKLMSHNTKLPVFVTFLILIVSEHFFGVWGLIVGIPTVMFLLDIFEVNGAEDKKTQLPL